MPTVAYPAIADETAVSQSAMEVVPNETRRTSVAAARAAQQVADKLINAVTVEETRTLVDVNIAEAVRRLPGISLEPDTGEGRCFTDRHGI
ncbi:MAG: TonB-Xanth-Caul: TonB-dependent receptor [Massilia sp.]|nr:TonB-Xanth-Caul: TonB-dependent receptor [Massilia sp.]